MLLTRLIDVMLSPLSFGLLLALLLWRSRAHLPRGLWRTGLVLEALCFVFTTPLGASALVGIEERRAASSTACMAPTPTTIVALSGGLRRAPRDSDDYGALNVESMQRAFDAANLVMATSGAELVISGGTRPGDEIAESTLMAGIARRLGVPAAAIRTEVTSRTTWENAQHVRALVPALPARIWLATSAMHMPRALIAFRAAGFEPCAHPGDFRAAPFREFTDLLPSGGAVSASAEALHELVGELAYRWRARR
ncbi:MAG: YdcF family protein [Dokdonella sp.]